MRTRIVVTVVVLLLAAAPMFAASGAFLKIEGIDGGSKQPGHEGWITLMDAGLGGSNGHEITKSHRLSVTKRFDSASCGLFEAAHTGKMFPTALLDIGSERHTLTNVRIVSFQDTGGEAGSGAMQRESVEIAFTNDTAARLHGTGPEFHQAASPVTTAANAILSGAGGAPAGILLRSVRVGGPGSATLVVCGNGMQSLQRAFLTRQRLPSLSLTASSGQHFTFSDATITGETPAGNGCNQLSLSFTRFAGPPAYDWHP